MVQGEHIWETTIPRPTKFGNAIIAYAIAFLSGEPCGCAYSSHKKEECPHPNPIKVKAYRKRKAEQDQERSAKRQQEGSEKDKEGPSFITFTQDFADQVAQEESEHETLSLIVNNVKEVEAEPQPLQELFKVLQ